MRSADAFDGLCLLGAADDEAAAAAAVCDTVAPFMPEEAAVEDMAADMMVKRG